LVHEMVNRGAAADVGSWIPRETEASEMRNRIVDEQKAPGCMPLS
jgi:hypothetical protein